MAWLIHRMTWFARRFWTCTAVRSQWEVNCISFYSARNSHMPNSQIWAHPDFQLFRPSPCDGKQAHAMNVFPPEPHRSINKPTRAEIPHGTRWKFNLICFIPHDIPECRTNTSNHNPTSNLSMPVPVKANQPMLWTQSHGSPIGTPINQLRPRLHVDPAGK